VTQQTPDPGAAEEPVRFASPVTVKRTKRMFGSGPLVADAMAMARLRGAQWLELLGGAR
jgi:hypothetical protein